MPHPSKALIFDMDGVLIDSEPLWCRAEIQKFAEIGINLSDADCELTRGMRIDEVTDLWFEQRPWSGASPEKVAQAIVERTAELVHSEGSLMPGVRGTLTWASHSDWRVALASSSPSFLIETVLNRFEIADFFEFARSAENERFGKPHPDVYLAAASDLQLDPSACVAIEDSANGVEAAIEAGMRCIAIPPPESRKDPRFAIATLQLETIRDLEKALQDI